MTLLVGMDIGKQMDPAAIAVVNQAYEPHPLDPAKRQTVYWVLGMRRWELGTSYMDLARDVCGIVHQPPLSNPPFAFDASGPGGDAFWDILKSMEPRCWLKPIGIVGGTGVTDAEEGKKNVSKVRLLAAMLVLYGSSRIRVVESAEKMTLERQVAILVPKITKDLKESIETPRDASGHCDLAMAVAMCCWLGENTAVGWDGSIGTPQSYAEGGSILGTAPPGVFLDTTGFKGPPPEKPKIDQLDEHGFPKGYIPPWGPGW